MIVRRLALVMLLVLVGCEGGNPPAPSTASSEPSTSSTLSPTEADRLEEITLTASFAELPARWTLRAVISFGDGEDQLGFAEPIGGGLNVLPRSFAIDGDGSIWILDVYKERVAHFSPRGSYLGSAGHLAFSSPWDARDLLWRDGRLYVLQSSSETVAARVTVVRGREQERPRPITYEGAPAVVYSIVPGTDRLIGELHGYAISPGQTLGTGPFGWVALEVPGSGAAELVPGVPTDGVSIDVRSDRDDADLIEATFRTAEATSIRPIRVELVESAGGVVLDPAMAVFVQGITAATLASVVEIQPAKPHLAERLGGGRWLLLVSGDGSSPVWERLPDHTIRDELQVRHVTVGGDGAIYLMLADRDGVRIYQR
jgi:hypothetical protein